jgi:hypothetical protein
LILVLAVHETEDLAFRLEWTVTRLRVTDLVTDFWTCVVLGAGVARNVCGLRAWLVPELSPANTTLSSAIRISSSAMTRWYALDRKSSPVRLGSCRVSTTW